uniref:SURP motif domain-containing protein n=1 Tax=Acrobeloides nanus TaxID=290746 RepID=A0A914EEI0_9BILA
MNIALSDIPLPPQPPADLETRNVIDKFAAYVAKNGPGFEEISRQKNADNPKFGFLFGGEHHQYYQFRLMWEIQQLKGGMIGYNNNQNQPNYPPPHVPILPVPLQTQSFDIGESRAQVDSIRNQIKESENNLQAQYEVLQKQKEMKVDEAVKNSEEKRIAELLEQVGLNIEPFTQLLDHLQSSCSKDTISVIEILYEQN